MTDDLKRIADSIDPRKWEVFPPTGELVTFPRSQLIAASDSLRAAHAEIERLKAASDTSFLCEALNSGDGVYRP